MDFARVRSSVADSLKGGSDEQLEEKNGTVRLWPTV